MGVLPTEVDCAGAKQWVGTNSSWGWIAGTGGKCHNEAKRFVFLITPASLVSSMTYGEKFGLGDVVGICLDFDAGTIEFFKNGKSQGKAR